MTGSPRVELGIVKGPVEKFPLILGNIKQLTPDHLSYLFQRAQFWLGNPGFKLPQPLGRRFAVMTLFLEHSTRTKLSFAHAAMRAGCDYLDFPVEDSSLKKGESLTETLYTLRAQGVDAVVIRSGDNNIFSQWRDNPPVKLINGGAGVDEHPSQALLDFFTFQQDRLPLKGSTLVIAGDVRHSRVANSLLSLAPYFNVKVILTGPQNFRPAFDSTPERPYQWEPDFERAFKAATRLYLLRIQYERHGESRDRQSNYLHDFGLPLERYQKLNLTAPVYHPGPCNIGTELDEALVRSPHYAAYRQVSMSIPMRQAILESMLLQTHELRPIPNSD